MIKTDLLIHFNFISIYFLVSYRKIKLPKNFSYKVMVNVGKNSDRNK